MTEETRPEDLPPADAGRPADGGDPADATHPSGPGPSEGSEGGSNPRVVISSEDGVAMADPSEDPTQGVPEPAKVMRIGTMIKQLLEEVKAAPLNEAARDKLADLHSRSVQELKGALSEELAEEIDRIVLPLSDSPSEPEIRVAHAQLVGWLEGLFHGIQTTLVAQQMMAQSQLKAIRRQLPPGVVMPQGMAGPGQGPSGSGEDRDRPGQYL